MKLIWSFSHCPPWIHFVKTWFMEQKANVLCTSKYNTRMLTCTNSLWRGNLLGHDLSVDKARKERRRSNTEIICYWKTRRAHFRYVTEPLRSSSELESETLPPCPFEERIWSNSSLTAVLRRSPRCGAAIGRCIEEPLLENPRKFALSPLSSTRKRLVTS